MSFVFLSLLALFNLIIVLNYKRYSSFVSLYDHIDLKRNKKKSSVLLYGGILIFLNIIFFVLLELIALKGENLTINIFPFLIIFFFSGFMDDKFNQNPWVRLFILVIISYLFFLLNDEFVISTLQFQFYDYKLSLGRYSLLFSIICMVVFINAINMLDGIDLMTSSYFFLFIIFLLSKGVFDNLLIVILISLIFFSIMNFFKKWYIGSSGIYLVCFILSYFLIYNYNKNEIFYIEEIFLIMSIPGFDLLRLFFVRSINKKSPLKPDLNHFHHILLKKYNQYTVVILVMAILFIGYLIGRNINFFIGIVFNLFFYSYLITMIKKNFNFFGVRKNR